MSGKHINSNQFQVYMDAREAGCSQTTAAAKAEFSDRSGRRIESGTHQPHKRQPRDWRTRVDPLVEVWQSELEPMLKREPKLEAMTLFEYLQAHYPGQYQRVLRTVQRRVSEWKAQHGVAPDVMFELRHTPGEMGYSDFTMTAPPPPPVSPYESLSLHLKRLKLSHMLHHWQRLEQQATQEHWSYAQFLLALSELEAQARYQSRIVRALSESQLPSGKALSNFEFAHCPSLNPAVVTQLAQEMRWIDQGENALINSHEVTP